MMTLYDRIYVDLVINHMTGGGSGTGTAGSAWNAGGSDSNSWGGQQYPAVPYGENDFHPPGTNSRQCSTSNMEIQNYGDTNQVCVSLTLNIYLFKSIIGFSALTFLSKEQFKN